MDDYVVKQLINGLAIGSIYALIAVGYNMVYGMLGLNQTVAHSNCDCLSTISYIQFLIDE